MKSWFGAAAGRSNWYYDYYLPLDKQYDMLQYFQLERGQGQRGYIAQGFNPIASLSNSGRVRDGLAQARDQRWSWSRAGYRNLGFWKNHGEFNDIDAASGQAEVFRLPHDLLRRGRRRGGELLARVLRWHWKAAKAASRARRA